MADKAEHVSEPTSVAPEVNEMLRQIREIDDLLAKESGDLDVEEPKEGEEGKRSPGLVLKIEGEDWIDVERSHIPAPMPAAPPLIEKEGETAGAKEVEATEEEVEAKEEVTKTDETETPMKSFIPSLFKLKKKLRSKQVEGGTTTKRKEKVKYDADKAYEVQYEVHTAHHEFDDKKPEQILDLCLIMDCTGSMASWIAHCKETLHKVIDATVARDPNCKVRTAFVGYRDFCDKNALFDLHDFSYDADKVKEFINNVEAKGGGDFPEDIHGGIRKALDLSWSPLDDSVKLAVLVADAPTHGKKYHVGHKHDDFPEGNPAGLVLEDLMKEMSDKEILLSLYQLNNENEVMYKAMKEAYAKGEEEDGVEFVDMRDIKPAPVKRRALAGFAGFGATEFMERYRGTRVESSGFDTTEFERETYTSLSSATIERQCSKMRTPYRASSRRSCKSGW